MNAPPPAVSVILPVFRNQDTLETLHTRLCSALESAGLSFELLFVDDACPAGSQAVLERLVLKDRRVAVIVLSGNIGQHSAEMVGLAHARGDLVATLDADLQDPPEALPMLIRELGQDHDVVFAGRQGSYQSGNRMFFSRLFKKILRMLTGIPVDAGTYMVARRPVIESMLHMRVERPHLVTLLGMTGSRLKSIPVERALRPTGVSGYSNWMRTRLGLEAVLLALRWRLGLIPYQAAFPLEQYPIGACLGSRFQKDH
jgi:polyisoprenyl-phosphate glycosyltransferase